MNHRDAMMSEVTVVLDDTPENTIDTITAAAKATGLQIEDVDSENGTIEGTIESCKLPDLRAVNGVKYIRISMEYIADFPVGDPRDLDGAEEA